jgi:hypothetical protein
MWLCIAAAGLAFSSLAAPSEAAMQTAVQTYFANLFQRLERAAEKSPTEATFREYMRPQIETVDGLFGATLINADWEIRQVYFRRDYLAVGYSLKNVSELDVFRKRMAEHPGPQLSEPGHGNLFQPRLIALRYPILKDGRMTAMVSMMVRTEAFLKAVGLNGCQAYRITCLGKEAEHSGTLQPTCKRITLALPSTEWTIEYD